MPCIQPSFPPGLSSTSPRRQTEQPPGLYSTAGGEGRAATWPGRGRRRFAIPLRRYCERGGSVVVLCKIEQVSFQLGALERPGRGEPRRDSHRHSWLEHPDTQHSGTRDPWLARLESDPHLGPGYQKFHAELPGKPPQLAFDLHFPWRVHVRNDHLRQVPSLLLAWSSPGLLRANEGSNDRLSMPRPHSRFRR